MSNLPSKLKNRKVPNAAPAGGGQAHISCPPLLVSGIDRLEVTFHMSFSKVKTGKVFDRLAEAKQSIQNGMGAECAFAMREGDFMTWNLQRTGTRLFSYVLRSGDIVLALSPRNSDSKLPNAQLIIGSLSCQQDALCHYENVLKWLEFYGLKPLEEKLGRCDLAVDLIGADIEQLGLLDRSRWIRRSRKIHTYYKDEKELLGLIQDESSTVAEYFMSNSLSGVMFGKGNIALRIYDKWFETAKSESKRKFFTEKWQLEEIAQTLGIDLEQDELSVVRVEFQLRREVLKEMQPEITTVKDLMINIDALWAYCTQNWIRQVVKVDRKNNNQSKADLTMFWMTIQDAVFHEEEQKEPCKRVERTLHKNVKALRDQIRGCMLTILAAFGHDCEDFFGMLATAADTITDDLAEYMTEYELDFRKKFATKQSCCFIGV